MPEKMRGKQPGAARKPATGSRPRRIADAPVSGAGALGATVRSPVTKSGLPVEEQIRKEWDPKQKGGLSTSLRRAGQMAPGR